MILNCFPNNTCQLFVDAPRSYKLQPTPGVLLYFPRQILPDPSECWMPNTSFLLTRLNATTPMYAIVRQPRSLVLDNHGYLVTASKTDRCILRFHPNNLTGVSQPPSPIFLQDPSMIAYHSGVYYVGFYSYTLAVDSTNMSQIHNISTSFLKDIRDIIFLSDGQLMIVASHGNNRLVFFNRSSSMPHNYDFVGFQNVTYPYPHGLFFGNDTLFYLTSWQDNTVYTYSYAGNITQWTEKLVLNASSVASSPNGYHVWVDNSGRYWFGLAGYGAKIFDSHGVFRGSLYPSGYYIFDILILDNFVVYLTDLTSTGKIIRIDPNISC